MVFLSCFFLEGVDSEFDLRLLYFYLVRYGASFTLRECMVIWFGRFFFGLPSVWFVLGELSGVDGERRKKASYHCSGDPC